MRRVGRRHVVAAVVVVVVLGAGVLIGSAQARDILKTALEKTPFIDFGGIELTSDMSSVPEKDQNKNNTLEGGDTIHFVYSIRNTTKKPIKALTLHTDIKRNEVHYIHNEKGVTGFRYEDGTIQVPNLNLQPNQKLELSFDARANYGDQAKEFKTTARVLGTAKEVAAKEERLQVQPGKSTMPGIIKQQGREQ